MLKKKPKQPFLCCGDCWTSYVSSPFLFLSRSKMFFSYHFVTHFYNPLGHFVHPNINNQKHKTWQEISKEADTYSDWILNSSIKFTDNNWFRKRVKKWLNIMLTENRRYKSNVKLKVKDLHKFRVGQKKIISGVHDASVIN